MTGTTDEQLAARAAVAEVFTDALAHMRSKARTQDWFVGYSTAEALQDRIAQIGTASMPGAAPGKTGRRLTQLAELDALETRVLAAIDAAREFKSIDTGNPGKSELEGDVEDDAAED